MKLFGSLIFLATQPILVCFLIGFVFASFVEYWLHRLMHLWPWFGQHLTAHYQHHGSNQGAGVLRALIDYSVGAPVVCLTFLISPSVGAGLILGSLVYAFFAAYAHQLQHENPAKCVWMEMPIHYVHHQHNLWHHNFGLAVDWWDRVFGTYKPLEWSFDEQLSQPERKYWQLKWW